MDDRWRHHGGCRWRNTRRRDQLHARQRRSGGEEALAVAEPVAAPAQPAAAPVAEPAAPGSEPAAAAAEPPAPGPPVAELLVVAQPEPQPEPRPRPQPAAAATLAEPTRRRPPAVAEPARRRPPAVLLALVLAEPELEPQPLVVVAKPQQLPEPVALRQCRRRAARRRG